MDGTVGVGVERFATPIFLSGPVSDTVFRALTLARPVAMNRVRARAKCDFPACFTAETLRRKENPGDGIRAPGQNASRN
ncbi:MAG: hypothetical protein DMG05_07395 [Acidobacteria bacterium]|nr:MAG: hypothetical protein DMG05_07395 [Acidobacteriota bacterium]